jgi:hypothetical protein
MSTNGSYGTASYSTQEHAMSPALRTYASGFSGKYTATHSPDISEQQRPDTPFMENGIGQVLQSLSQTTVSPVPSAHELSLDGMSNTVWSRCYQWPTGLGRRSKWTSSNSFRLRLATLPSLSLFVDTPSRQFSFHVTTILTHQN